MGFHSARYLGQFTLCPHLNPRCQQIGDHRGTMAGVERPVDQQAFGGTANSGAPCLGVQHHGARHLRIGVAVDIDVADTFQMGKHRHPRLCLHQRHQPFAAARHHHVDQTGQAQHRRNGGTVTGRHQLDRGIGQTRLFQTSHQTVMNLA